MTDDRKAPATGPFSGFRKRTYRLGPLLRDSGHVALHPLRMHAIFIKRTFDGRLRGRIMFAVSSTNDCRYCVAIHHQGGLWTGSSAEELAGIGDGDLAVVDALDAAAIAYAVELAEENFARTARVRSRALLDLPAPLRRDVEVIARFMTVANRCGNTFDALRARRRGVPDPTGSVLSEIVVTGIFLLGSIGQVPRGGVRGVGCDGHLVSRC